MSFILQIFGKMLLAIYNFSHSYALALIVFTLLTKVVLFPLTYKGKKSMMQTTSLNAELQKLQKQYGKDRERLNQETQALYEREGVNPMSGCLWSFLPLPILMGLYAIIRRPMFYMMCLTQDEIAKAVEAVTKMGVDLGTSNTAYQELRLAGMMGDSSVFEAVKNAVGASADKLAVINFKFLGIDLSMTPTWKFWTLDLNWGSIGLFLIPIVVTVVNFGYSQLSQKTNAMTNGKKENDPNDSTAQTMKTMNYTMPLMYLWFGYIMPAGMCIYMLFNAVFMAIQELICARMLRGKFEELERARAQRAAEAKEQEKQRKAEIAARRAEQEKLKGKKKMQAAKSKKKGNDGKGKDRPTEDSRVGMRPFARGRAYDPNRYPITPYRDPQDVMDEAALEAALSKKSNKSLKAEEEVEAPVEEVATLEAPEVVEEVAEEVTESAETTEE